MHGLYVLWWVQHLSVAAVAAIRAAGDLDQLKISRGTSPVKSCTPAGRRSATTRGDNWIAPGGGASHAVIAAPAHTPPSLIARERQQRRCSVREP